MCESDLEVIERFESLVERKVVCNQHTRGNIMTQMK